ncbi:V-type proton ATPase subunit S1 [Protopterus annectens]|uniref:V-type proton ATPase subunit S1 n=1 Tax=Protopterus annectens TaxID=7888 RepID=UPI001CFA522B|nr:V-type proton ATPase subunit S1 [Protopterus annectens]
MAEVLQLLLFGRGCRGRVLLLPFLLTLWMTHLGYCSDHIPVLMWSTEGSLWNPQDAPNEGEVVSGSKLISYLNPAVTSGPKVILLFLQEKMSIDDFTLYGGVYGNKQDSVFSNLESAMESAASSLVLPAVDWYASNSLSAYLQEKVGTSPLYVDPVSLHELKLNESIPSLLVVRLPYTSSGILEPKDVLRSNDDIIGRVLNPLKSEGMPYTALLTALTPSRVVRDVAFAIQNTGRQLLQTSTTTYPPLAYNQTGKPCILFWASRIVVGFGNQHVEVTNETFQQNPPLSLSGSSCESNVSRLVLNYKAAKGFDNLKLTFVMSKSKYAVSNREWFTMERVEISANQTNATFNASDIYAPATYSFHCQYVSNLPRYSSMLVPRFSTNWELTITDFQIQGFGLNGTNGTNFAYASDCTGFFTPGIWMGLVTTLLFVFILTYGLHMIMNLKTMDRFDDPKGPTISVPQTE